MIKTGIEKHAQTLIRDMPAEPGHGGLPDAFVTMTGQVVDRRNPKAADYNIIDTAVSLARLDGAADKPGRRSAA